MKSLNVKFDLESKTVTLDFDTYHELRQFAIHHGETDLPAIPTPKPAEIFVEPKKESAKKPT